MANPILRDIGINLLAAGFTSDIGISRKKVSETIRQYQNSEDLDALATEFNEEFKRAFEEENELEESSIAWDKIIEHLDASQSTSNEIIDDELELFFKNEQEAISELADTIVAVSDIKDANQPETREKIERSLARAYQRTIEKFEQQVAGTDFAELFEAETGLTLTSELDEIQERLDRLREGMRIGLDHQMRSEGFQMLSPRYLQQVSPSPEESWRTGFSLADVYEGIPARRSGHDEEKTADAELFEALEDGNDRLVVGPPGSGKSTLCKQVAVGWYNDADKGAVLYREGGIGARQFESVGTLYEIIRQAESPVLVVVEDAVRDAAKRIFSVIDELQNDPDVRFLLDAREQEVDQFGSIGTFSPTKRRYNININSIPRYQLPTISEQDIARVIEAFENSTGRNVKQDISTLHRKISEATTNDIGAFLLLSYHLPISSNAHPLESAPSGLEAHVQARYETLTNSKGRAAPRDLTRFDSELLADVGVMVNLLHAAGIGIYPELVHALGYEYGHDLETHDQIAQILRSLEGWFLFSAGETNEGMLRTPHELWSISYLRRLATDYNDRQISNRRRDRSEPRVGRCLNALFALFENNDHVETLIEEFPDSEILDSILNNPEGAAADYVEPVFEIGEYWPVLAPLFGIERTARYELPEICPVETLQEVYLSRGHAHRKWGAYEEAQAEYDLLLDQAEERDDLAGKVAGLNNLGRIARQRGDYDAARSRFEQSFDIAREIDDRAGEVTSLSNLGQVAARIGDYDLAEDFLMESLELARDLGDRGAEVNNLNELGLVKQSRGELELAREYFEQSFEIADEIDDRIGKADSLGNLGLVLFEQDRYESAREHLHRSFELAHEVGDRAGKATSLGNLGLVARQQGDYEAAREYFERSLALKRKFSNRADEADTLGNLGLVALELGDYEDAREYFERSLEIARDIGDRSINADSLRNLGQVAHQQGDYEAAQEYFERSLDIAVEVGDRTSEADILSNLGRIAYQQGDFQSAVEYCRTALDIQKPWARTAAVRTLSTIGSEHPELIHEFDDEFATLLCDSDRSVREAVATNLAEVIIENPSDFPETIKSYRTAVLNDSNSEIRLTAIKTLAVIANNSPKNIDDFDELISTFEELKEDPDLPKEDINRALAIVRKAQANTTGGMG